MIPIEKWAIENVERPVVCLTAATDSTGQFDTRSERAPGLKECARKVGKGLRRAGLSPVAAHVLSERHAISGYLRCARARSRANLNGPESGFHSARQERPIGAVHNRGLRRGAIRR